MAVPKKANKKTKLSATLVATAGRLTSVGKSPDEQFGELFKEVQEQRVYEDGMTFVGLVPVKRVNALKKEYALSKNDPNFNLAEFVSRHFQDTSLGALPVIPTERPKMTVREYVTWLWPYLTRTTHEKQASLFPLPHSYIVPGGRFKEQFYWDTYFVMLGLASDDNWDLIHGMIRNFVFMADKLGYIPTGNRTYYVSRSQPPFFANMVRLMLTKKNKFTVYAETLPTLLNEYGYWMKGRKKTKANLLYPAYKRVVQMPNGTFLNRYFDDKTTPRPESHREDVETADESNTYFPDKIFLDLRAAAESGWDFSSRWFGVADDIHTIHTTDFIPVDLNCLLYMSELTIADGYKSLLQPLLAKKYREKATKRAEAIQSYMWDDASGWYVDYDLRSACHSSSVTLAGMFALYASVATPEQAGRVAERLEKDFLKPGGLVTTLVENGQQWDSPNGWAPLQWVAVVGLRNYGFSELAERIKQSWMSTIETVYGLHGKIVEKYNVIEPTALGGGGEYPLQDGFGWTNGVYSALHDRLDERL